MPLDTLGDPIGDPLPGWVPPQRPPREVMVGRFSAVEPLDPERHGRELFEANAADATGRAWTYLPYGPFSTLGEFRSWMRSACLGDDPLFHALVDVSTSRAVGVASYLRIMPASGSIEIGHINFSPGLQRSPAATEAMYLMMKRAFDLGYRRYEWKCDALNARSRRAAQRLGFSFEGVFRQATVYKNRNRDTAWYAIIDREWPGLDVAFRRWLAADNFEPDGRQRTSLSALTAPLLHARG